MMEIVLGNFRAIVVEEQWTQMISEILMQGPLKIGRNTPNCSKLSGEDPNAI